MMYMAFIYHISLALHAFTVYYISLYCIRVLFLDLESPLDPYKGLVDGHGRRLLVLQPRRLSL